MGDFFYGWRRKIGVVTLVMACVFAVGWVRSWNYEDMIVVGTDGTLHLICSSPQGIGWESSHELDCATSVDITVTNCLHFEQHPFDHKHRTSFFSSATTIITKLEWGGFTIGKILHESPSDPRSECSIWAIPYWSVVVPLSLLSSYLLLKRPRKRISDKQS